MVMGNMDITAAIMVMGKNMDMDMDMDMKKKIIKKSFLCRKGKYNQRILVGANQLELIF